ncbi:MAG TPA: oligosaccharide flippase family protein [Oligoflexia bacterium]|nr:oligosaccharide flippase family protein [Oligoflexia bacterium]HMP48567.1 oligosaccharide flippase family protein [Oligoflexia bacterium]
MPSNDLSTLNNKNRLKFLFKDTFLYGVSTSLSRAVSLITFPLLARSFSVEEYGLIDLFLFFSSFLAIFLVFGQDSAVARFFYEYKDEENRKQLISQSLAIQFLLILIVLPSVYFFSSAISSLLSVHEKAETIFLLNLLQVPCMVLVNFSQNLLKWTFSRKKFLFISLGSVFSYMMLIVIGILYLKMEVEGVFICALISQIVFGVTGIFFIKKWLVIPKNFYFLKDLVPYAIPFGIICALSSFMPTVERSLVDSFLGATELGLYAAGAKVAMLLTLVIQAFQTAWGPFSLSIHKEADAAKTYNVVLKVFAALVCVSVFFLSAFAEPVINILASDRFSGASIVVFPLAMGLAIQSIGWITEIGIGLSKKSYLNLYSYFAFFVFTLGGIYILAPHMGILGVGIAVMLGQIVKSIIATYFSFRAYQLDWKYAPVLIFVILNIILGFLSLYLRIQYPLKNLMFIDLSILSILLFSAYLFVLSSNERLVVVSGVSSLLKNLKAK